MSERQRPTRACRVRSSQAPSSGSTEVNRARTQASQVPAFASEPQPSSVDPDQLRKLRSMWQLASVINFFETFCPILKLEKRFTAQELEIALLYPSALLVDVHIGLLKGVSPPMRSSLNHETWATALYKKLKDRWAMVSDAPFPLAGAHGKETEAYKELDVASRLTILKALCECRLDQDDVRIFMEASGKKDASAFRKERCGTDSHGTTYWYEDGPVSGYRLYKEFREIRKLTEKDARGTAALPSPTGDWETMASSLDEFRVVAGNLSNSRNRQELALAKRLLSDTIPVLEELQKKKERILKRQQRQALLLDNSLSQENGRTAGRALRDRKQVKYTFDEFERSITEAIKYTKKQPESTPKSNGGAPTANGHAKVTRSKHKEPVRQRKELEHDYSDGRSSGSDKHEPFDGAGPAPSEDAQDDSPSSSARRRKRSRSNVRKEYSYNEDEEDIYSDDEIEGEAIYDEEFVRRRKWRKGYTSSPEYGQEDDKAVGERGDAAAATDSDSYKGEEDEDDEYDEEEEAEPVQRWSSRTRPVRRVRQSKLLVAKTGLRRSQRNKRRRVNYRAEESDVEEEEEEDEDEPPPVRRRREKEAPSGSSSIEDRDSESSGRDNRQEEEEDVEQEEEPGLMRDDDGEGGEEEQEEEVEQGEGSPAVAEERRERRFLDLNECAPSESPRDQRSAVEATESEEATMLLF